MLDDRTFECQAWMALQATEFAFLMQNAGDEFDLTIKGDGLLAYILETGASPPQDLSQMR
jgi:hypothetical protein